MFIHALNLVICPYWCREGAHASAEDHQLAAEDHQITAEDHQISAENHQITAEDHQITAEDQHIAAESQDNKTVAREASAQETTDGGLLVDALLTQEDPAAINGESSTAFKAGRLCFGKSHLHIFLQETHFG